VARCRAAAAPRSRLIHLARAAAEHGEREFLLLRFPSGLCADNGRMINVGEANWPASLRGEAAELYLRWKQDLRTSGLRSYGPNPQRAGDGDDDSPAGSRAAHLDQLRRELK
jgi:hypothetical protein